MNRLFVIVRLIAGVSAACFCPVASFAVESLNASMEKKETTLDRLIATLYATKDVARVNYKAVCYSNEVIPNTYPQAIRFPDVKTQLSLPSADGLSAVRSLFRGNDNVRITEGGNNLIRIGISDPDDLILRTKISTVTFTQEQQYDPRAAIKAIFDAPEIGRALKRFKMKHILGMEDYTSAEPSEGEPHLDRSVENLSLDKALDLVAITFNGAVVFGACEKPSVFDVEFFPVYAIPLPK